LHSLLDLGIEFLRPQKHLEQKDVMWQYGETTEAGCSWSAASYYGPGDRADKNIPHGSRPGRFPEQVAGKGRQAKPYPSRGVNF